jgi:hypothetical protein
MNPDQIRKWRVAYAEIDVKDAALEQMQDCASLYGGDYTVYLESKGNEAAPFVRSAMKELAWAYGNWQKAQRDRDASKLLSDMMNNASGGNPEYEIVRKFIQDYSSANNIPLTRAVVERQGFDFDTLPKSESTVTGAL